jgi:AcrR family transcriptional regulator
MNDRLTPSDWVAHGLRTLANDGPNGLKVGAMAEKLNVSRGSFYWHFQDIADFRTKLLQAWREQTTDQVIQRLEAKEAGVDRLKWLMKRAFGAAPKLDRAIRRWAADDADVAAMVASVDAGRIAYIADLLVASGVERRRARHRATFIYWAYLGQATIADSGHASMPSSALDDVSSLFEG